jgi:riboflavin kinase/FMN adenylyltransferase
MQEISGIRFVTGIETGAALTFGNFDGVHLGHQMLLKKLVEVAQARGLKAVVVTFEPHPAQILFPERPFFRLFDLEDQREQFKKIGIDLWVQQKFDLDFSYISSADFIKDWLMPYLNPKWLGVGHDSRFGRGKTGQADLLHQLAIQHQFEVFEMKPFLLEGELVSSSAIRRALVDGDLMKARKLLGRPYYLRGIVESGAKRGRTLGFPTANLSKFVHTPLNRGVYATRLIWHGQVWPSVTNIGINPTFETRLPSLKCETHVFDFDKDLYNQEVRIEFDEFIRDEEKFENIDRLKEQIQKDCVKARKILGSK